MIRCNSFLSTNCSFLINKRIGIHDNDGIRNFLNLIQPGDDFIDLVKLHTPNANDLMLVDVYSDSMPLLLNQVAFFKLMNISVTVIAIAYEDNVCNHNTASNDLYGSDTVLYELAVFSGRMNMKDIQKMEHHLMQKHGIVAQKVDVHFI